MQTYNVVFYDLPNGKEPAIDFLSSLDTKMREKMNRTIELLQNYGPDLREPYSKHLKDGIYELRARSGNDITRVLYFFEKNKIIILTHGFVKKTQKTPEREIEKAKKYRNEYLNRKKKK